MDWSLTPSTAVCGHPRETGALLLLAGPQLRQQELPLCISRERIWGVGSGGPGGNRAHGGGGGGSTKGLLRTAMVNIPNNLFLFTFLHVICIS